MDAQQIHQLEPELLRFLDQFNDCFSCKDTRAHLGTYVQEQLPNLPQKSVEPIALEAGVAPRTLQEFLSQFKWDKGLMHNRLLQIMATEHAGPHTIGIIDETSDPKKGGQDTQGPEAVVRPPGQDRELHGHRPSQLRQRRLPLPAQHRPVSAGELGLRRRLVP